MADRSKKEPTPPPLLLMPAGGGLTLTPPDQENVLMPVVQAEASLFGPEDEVLGEVDSFVGQSPPSSHTVPPQLPLATSGLFQGSPGTSTDPFSQVGKGPFVGAPNTVNAPRPPLIPTASSAGQAPFAPAAPPMAAVPPMPTASGLSNLYRKHGSNRYAPMPAGTFAPSPSTLMSTAPAPIPFSQNFSEAATLEPTPTSSLTSMEPGLPSTQPPPASLGPMPGMGYVAGATGIYVPVNHHWCYCKNVEGREIWYPFPMADNLALEDGLKEVNLQGGEVIVSTDGGRYDVNLAERLRYAVYWEEEPVVVKRCSWFFKREGDNRYVPYDEEVCIKLEDEYRTAINSGVWHKRLEFSGGETIVMHNPNVMVHFQPSSHPDEWGTLQVSSPQMVQGDQMRPRVVKRGVGDFESIDEGESRQIDHLVFVVHGIGSICDIRFRSIVECVDDFRTISQNLLKSHFTQYVESSRIGRVEFIPIHWHKALHGDATGIDKRLKAITLPSTAKLRHFVNDTLMDVLFYTSPTYCQWIAETVGTEMNRLYSLFLSRNPQFKGAVSVAGHSLGSCILFDLLQHQGDQHVEEESNTESETGMVNGQVEPPVLPDLGQNDVEGVTEEEETEEVLSLEQLLSKVGLEEKKTLFEQEQMDMESLIMCSESDLKDLGLPMGPRKKLQGLLKEEQNKKNTKKLAAEKRVKEEEERKLREKITRELSTQGKTPALVNGHSYREKTLNISTSTNKRTSMVIQTKQAFNQGRQSSTRSTTYLEGPAGTGQPQVHYPKLDFDPVCCFSLGSPIGLFLSARGMEIIGESFTFPTCQKFFNIFHPFDPVAYRLEPLINPHASSVKPVLMPHHKGRKRLHLELKDSLAKVGADIKQKIIDSLKSTWNSINDFAKAHKDERSLEQQVDSEMSSVVQQMVDDEHSDTASVLSNMDEDLYVGQLNEGRRIDYVLQERPIESFNDYMFSLTSHGCYWNSEDTVLLVLKEIYSLYGVAPTLPGSDGAQKQAVGPPPRSSQPNIATYNMNQSAQPSFPSQVLSQPLQPPSGYSERPPPPPSQGHQPYGMGPPVVNPQAYSMVPPQVNSGSPQTQPGANVGPPPMMGFMRATPKS